MKLETALRHANSVAEQLKSVNGFIHTPLNRRDGIKVKRMWLFGSTAKGKKKPNDVDILIESVEFGKTRCSNVRNSYLVDYDYKKRYGVTFPKKTSDTALKWLKDRRRNVNLHLTEWVSVDIDVKILLYPRNDLKNMSQN